MDRVRGRSWDHEDWPGGRAPATWILTRLLSGSWSVHVQLWVPIGYRDKYGVWHDDDLWSSSTAVPFERIVEAARSMEAKLCADRDRALAP